MKRLVALFLVLLLSIESFGAVVSDNDGSAFITKAEFDSLKNNFQSQIDQYNTSIDSKIDGAIASYLAGIAQTRTYEIINNQWTDWIMLNKILQNDYHMPTMHAMIDLSSHYHSGSPNYVWRTLDKFVHANGNLSYTNSSNDNKKNVAVVTLDNVGNLDNTKIFWKGRALNCKEIYNLNAILKNDNFGWAYLGYYDRTTYANKLFVSAPCTFAKTGYVKPYLNNASDPFWNPKIKFFYSATGSSWSGKNDLGATSTFQSCALGLEYNVNDKGVAWDYEHIGCYRKNDELELNGFNVNSIIKLSSNQTKNSKDLLDSATKYGKWDGIETDYQNGTSGVDYSGTLTTYNHVWGKPFDWYDTDDPTESSIVYKQVKLPTIGLIGNKKAYEIYQFDPAGIGDGTLPKVSLNAGYLAFDAAADVEIDWTVYFNSITSSSLSIPSTTEIGIALAVGPFDDEINVVNLNRIIYFDNNKSIKYAKTTNKKARLKFSVPDSGYVYMKFFPYILNADGSINWSLINSEKWEISFNPNLSKQYSVS